MEGKLNKEIPKVLVETWIYLARNDECDKEVRTKALQNLISSIGSVEKVTDYMKRHKIK